MVTFGETDIFLSVYAFCQIYTGFRLPKTTIVCILSVFAIKHSTSLSFIRVISDYVTP